MDELEKAWKEANSMIPGDEPGDLIFLGIKPTENDDYYLYREENTENYWYQSKGTETFHKEIKEREKEKKACSKRLENTLRKASA